MSLTSLSFFLFLATTVVLYYLSGKRLQKYVLLFASIYFYFQTVTIEANKVIAVLLYIVLVTYAGALLIQKCTGKVKTVVATLSVSALVAALFVLKYAYNMVHLVFGLFRMDGDVSWLHFASLMGISYFVLSAIGYLMDVYWGSYKAERNG
ncbi:MAG: hypothetical protein E7287_06270, partial [Lachnospiraceae bacterium]|nr:hypothetical protein [Lachnospiraceae bacterium]